MSAQKDSPFIILIISITAIFILFVLVFFSFRFGSNVILLENAKEDKNMKLIGEVQKINCYGRGYNTFYCEVESAGKRFLLVGEGKHIYGIKNLYKSSLKSNKEDKNIYCAIKEKLKRCFYGSEI